MWGGFLNLFSYYNKLPHISVIKQKKHFLILIKDILYLCLFNSFPVRSKLAFSYVYKQFIRIKRIMITINITVKAKTMVKIKIKRFYYNSGKSIKRLLSSIAIFLSTLGMESSLRLLKGPSFI